MLPELHARGERVEVRTVRPEDVPGYRVAVQASAARLSRWNPVDPDDLNRHLRAQSTGHRTFVIRAHDAAGAHGIVGKVNVTNVVRGRFQSGAMGYDAYDPYVGRGLFAEGLRLVIDLAFTREPEGMGLHRVEANVQPRNATSAGVLRKLGFRREGHVSRMLWLADGSGREAWRDHDAYAITADEWPADAWAPHHPARSVVLVNGLPGSGKTTLARSLARELGVPLLSKDVLKEKVGGQLPHADVDRLGGRGSALGAGCHEALWALLADSPVGGVVESWFHPSAHHYTSAGLDGAGVAAEQTLQVWCEVPPALARQRFEGRADSRPAVHGPQLGQESMWAELAQVARPLDLPHTVRVDTTSPVTARTVAALALQARAVSART